MFIFLEQPYNEKLGAKYITQDSKNTFNNLFNDFVLKMNVIAICEQSSLIFA